MKSLARSNVVSALGSPFREKVIIDIPSRPLTFDEAAELCAELMYEIQEMDYTRRMK